MDLKEFGPIPVTSARFVAAIPGQMMNSPFTGVKDPALNLSYNAQSESFPHHQQLELSKPVHACFEVGGKGGTTEDQKTAVNTKDSPAVNAEHCNSILHLLNLFPEPY